MGLVAAVLAGNRSGPRGRRHPHAAADVITVSRIVAALYSTPMVREVWLVVNDYSSGAILAEATPHGVKVVEDDPGVGCGGPARALATLLVEAANRMLAELIVVPGDLPRLGPSALSRLIEYGKGYGAEAASPWWGNGFVEHLVLYVHAPGAVAGTFLDLCRVKGARSRASDLLRLLDRVVLVPVEALGDPSTFAASTGGPRRNMRRRIGVTGAQLKVVDWGVGGAPLPFVIELLTRGKLRSAYDALLSEAKGWLEHGVNLLAYHASLDALAVGKEAGLDVLEAESLAGIARSRLSSGGRGVAEALGGG